MLDTSNPLAVRQLIESRHWNDGQSLRQIERELGIGKTVLSSACKRHGVAVRSRGEQMRITGRTESFRASHSGENHWCYGKRRPDSAARMRRRNPMAMPGVRERAAVGKAKAWRRKPTESEALFRDILRRCRAEFGQQYVAGGYVIDFAFPRYRVALEIDGKGHGSAGRNASDIERDGHLVDRGWKVIRVRQENLRFPGKLLAVLEQHIPDLDPPGGFPSGRRQYRVLVRDAESPAGRKV